MADDNRILNEIARLAFAHQRAAADYDRKFNLPWYYGWRFVGFIYSIPAWRRYLKTLNDVQVERKRFLSIVRRRIQMRWGYN